MLPRDFPRGPVVKNPPYSAGDVGLIPGWGTKIPCAAGQLESLCTAMKDPTGQSCTQVSKYFLKNYTYLKKPLCSLRKQRSICFFIKKHKQDLNKQRPVIILRGSILKLFFPGGSDRRSAHKAGDPGSIPWLERSPEKGSSNPLQYSCLENSMGRGAWRATVHGVAKSWTRLSN